MYNIIIIIHAWVMTAMTAINYDVISIHGALIITLDFHSMHNALYSCRIEDFTGVASRL